MVQRQYRLLDKHIKMKYQNHKYQIVAHFLLSLSVIFISINSCSEHPRVEKEFFENGALKREIIYYDSKDTTSFIARAYYKSGQLKYYAEFKNGKREGKYCYYFENGKIKDKMHFSDGLLDGIVRFYNVHNELREEFFYINGKLILDKEFWKNPVYHLYQTRVYVPVNVSVKNDIGTITYDSTGKVIEGASFFYDVMGPDTVSKGDNVKYFVKFLNKRDDFLFELCLGELTPEAELKDTLLHYVTANDTIAFSITAKTPGEHIMTGIIYLKGDTILKYPFYKEYYVLDK